MSLPQLMKSPGGRPTPRNESTDSATIAEDSEIVVTTIAGAIAFGITCFIMVAMRDRPRASAAITKSAFFTRRISLRTILAVIGQENPPIASAITSGFRWSESTLITTTAARMYGIEKKISPIRDRTESVRPTEEACDRANSGPDHEGQRDNDETD